MNAELLTAEKIVFFFNKYKYNTDLITRLERKLLSECYDFPKWEKLLSENSELTRKLFRANELLLSEYINPIIENPEKISQETLQTLLTHITFFLFENNVDLLVTDDVLNAILAKPEILNPNTKFNALMNLGISKTVSGNSTFEEVYSIFEEALGIFPKMEDAGDYDTRLHLIFCRTFELLAFDLYDTKDYAKCFNVYNEIIKLLEQADQKLLEKMWGENADYGFKKDYLLRFFRIYGIYFIGKQSFELSQNASDEDKNALSQMSLWLTNEYEAELQEGEVNNGVYTYYWKSQYVFGNITREKYNDQLFKIIDKTQEFIFPELSFPDDCDPIDPKFSRMLDRMKLCNRTSSYVYILLVETFKSTEDEDIRRMVLMKLQHFFESELYNEKGFVTDNMVMSLLETVADGFDDINNLILFIQTIFIHREISTAIHLGMVSSLAGICLYHILEKHPEFLIIPGYTDTVEMVLEKKYDLMKFIKNGALLHDIGKLGCSNLINLHYRKISQYEFEQIKKHTERGYQLVERIKQLEPIKDFVFGHHKFWNDKGGYPENYKIQESKYKNIVALTSICDCIDTATDHRGRNYTEVKSFDTVFQELIQESGTRYNPVVIKYISEDAELKAEIEKLTIEGRNYNSYQTYLRFVQPLTTFSLDDEKFVSPLDENTKKGLTDFYHLCYPKLHEGLLKLHIVELTCSTSSKIFVVHNRNYEVFGVLAGYTSLNLNNGEIFFSINDLIILPEFRRKGLGTELLSKTIEYLKKEGITQLKVNAQNDFNSETFFWISGFSQSKQYIMEKEI